MDSIRDHPIWLFGAGVAAASAFVVTIYVPMITTYLTAQIETLKPVQERLKTAEEANAALVKELIAVKAQRDAALQTVHFAGLSVYPNSLGTVVLGSPFAKVSAVYKKIKIFGDDEKRPDYVSVDTGHPFFHTATYYPNYDNRGGATVKAILFYSPMNSAARLAHHNHFSQVFGSPFAESRGRTFWKATPRENIELDLDSLYVTLPTEVPLWFNKKASR